MSVFLFTKVPYHARNMPPAGQALEVELEMISFLSTAQWTAWLGLGKSHNQIVKSLQN